MPEVARDQALTDSIRDELIDQWMSDTPKRIFIVPLCAALGFSVMYGLAPLPYLLVWIMLISACSLWRYGLYLRYRRAQITPQARVTSARSTGLLTHILCCVTLLGLSWGMSMVLAHFYGHQSPFALATVGVITAGMAVVTIAGMYPQAGLLMTLGIFCPFIAWSLILGSVQSVLLALGAVIYITILIIWSKGLYLNVVNTMLLRHENDHLVRQLSLAKETAEKANLDKSRFLAAASHDLRQPMQGLWLFVGNLRQYWGQKEGLRILDHVEASLDAMRSLFDSLLNISQLDSGGIKAQLRAHPMQTSLNRLASEFSAACDHGMLRFKLWPCSRWVQTDPVLLDRILLNLVANAVKYTPSGGGILVGCRTRGDTLVIQVWDTGVGIAQEHHQLIFEEFAQLNNPERDRNKGIGLGLAISMRLAQLIGATLEMKSQPGRGSVFSISLPLVRSTEIAQERLPFSADLSILRGKCLAFVDDEVTIVTAVRSLCDIWGVEVVGAGDLTTLLETLGGRVPDAIISDYRLGGNSNGSDVIAHVRQHFPQTPALPAALLSGDTENNLATIAKSQNIRLIYKPISTSNLQNLLIALFQDGRPPAQPASGS